ncbi:MAG: PLP-dependent aminotransferase family protein [Caldilinea sp. CFX5]|nr:PLP-dependent aminotransferase family protein [Caldilinea sp. CFX5]
MSKQVTAFDLAAILPELTREQSLYQQLYDGLRQAILSGRLRAGMRLPSTRDLSTVLGVSRNTTMATFEQLVAEGYLESRVGDGTYVSLALPDELALVNRRVQPANALQQALAGEFSQRHRRITAAPMGGASDDFAPRAFRTGIPALDMFPTKVWARLAAHRWRTAGPELLTYGDACGYWPLRQAIAEYLGAARGVRCTAEQVLITAGSQHALDLVAQVLLDPDDPVWIEDPGYRGARAALLGVGVHLMPIPVDAEGLCVDIGAAQQPTARLIYVTPSHQYPTGATMSVTRRLALLAWARQHNAWILEDDYDSEYRYRGRPLAALQGLDQADECALRTGPPCDSRVLYSGTFSKVLFPGLRLGYLVTPPSLTEAFSDALFLAHRYLPVFDQAVLADFILDGHFARHIRRMRTLYAERQQVLVTALQQQLSAHLTVGYAEAGLHLVAWCNNGLNDEQIAEAAWQQGVEVAPISAYVMGAPIRSGLVLGYGMLKPEEIRIGVQKLAGVFTSGF